MISVITPAHNEEQFIGKCLGSVTAAVQHVDQPVEHIVVLNRCTDRTKQIAEDFAAKTIVEDARNLSCIRNAGVAAARGEIVVTIDADSWMSEGMLREVCRLLDSGKYVGGGARIHLERISLGILCSMLVIAPFIFRRGHISGGMFWCRKRDFDAIGGFDESLRSLEDFDFAHRLKKYGRQKGLKYGTIRRAKLTTSCRKFDMFGDWYMVCRPWQVYRIVKGHKPTVDEFYYDVRSNDRLP